MEVNATSGTTGKSVPVFATKKDIDNWSDLNARELWMTGMRPGDILMNCYDYGLATGGFGFHYGAMAMDVMAMPMGSDARQYERGWNRVRMVSLFGHGLLLIVRP